MNWKSCTTKRCAIIMMQFALGIVQFSLFLTDRNCESVELQQVASDVLMPTSSTFPMPHLLPVKSEHLKLQSNKTNTKYTQDIKSNVINLIDNDKKKIPYRLLCTDKFYVRMTFVTKLMSKVVDVCHSGLICLQILHEIVKFLLQDFNVFQVPS